MKKGHTEAKCLRRDHPTSDKKDKKVVFNDDIKKNLVQSVWKVVGNKVKENSGAETEEREPSRTRCDIILELIRACRALNVENT